MEAAILKEGRSKRAEKVDKVLQPFKERYQSWLRAAGENIKRGGLGNISQRRHASVQQGSDKATYLQLDDISLNSERLRHHDDGLQSTLTPLGLCICTEMEQLPNRTEISFFTL